MLEKPQKRKKKKKKNSAIFPNLSNREVLGSGMAEKGQNLILQQRKRPPSLSRSRVSSLHGKGARRDHATNGSHFCCQVVWRRLLCLQLDSLEEQRKKGTQVRSKAQKWFLKTGRRDVTWVPCLKVACLGHSTRSASHESVFVELQCKSYGLGSTVGVE